MKLKMIVFNCILIVILTGCARPLKMSSPSTLQLSGINQHPYTAGLFVPQTVNEFVYVKATSLFNKISYPIGEQTHLIFKKNLPFVFKSVAEVSSIMPDQNVDIVIKPSIVKFSSTIWDSAYKKSYSAVIVYHIDVYNENGEKILMRTAAGNAQIFKGELALKKDICAEVAQIAMEEAVKKIIQELSKAEELQHIK
jgi:hypothetical protein